VWTRGLGVLWRHYERLADGTILTKGCGAGPPEQVVLKHVNVGLGVCFRSDYTAKALCGKFEKNILRNETALPYSNFYIPVSVSDLYIRTIVPQTQYSKIGGPIVGIFKSLTDT
jgi:hypothetical protein